MYCRTKLRCEVLSPVSDSGRRLVVAPPAWESNKQTNPPQCSGHRRPRALKKRLLKRSSGRAGGACYTGDADVGRRLPQGLEGEAHQPPRRHGPALGEAQRCGHRGVALPPPLWHRPGLGLGGWGGDQAAGEQRGTSPRSRSKKPCGPRTQSKQVSGKKNAVPNHPGGKGQQIRMLAPMFARSQKVRKKFLFPHPQKSP